MRRIPAYAVILLVAGACTLGEITADYGDPVDMRPADLVGTWRSGAHRSIVLDEDQTFTATELPYEAFESFVPAGFERQDDGVVSLFFFYVGSGGNSWCSYRKIAGMPG